MTITCPRCAGGGNSPDMPGAMCGQCLGVGSVVCVGTAIPAQPSAPGSATEEGKDPFQAAKIVFELEEKRISAIGKAVCLLVGHDEAMDEVDKARIRAVAVTAIEAYRTVADERDLLIESWRLVFVGLSELPIDENPGPKRLQDILKALEMVA